MTTILLVDDQWELLAIHDAYLRAHGFRVLTAGDGMSALESVRTHGPDIIVLDHSLPRLTGIDVARELKADPRTAGIPIVMMSAHAYGAVGHRARAVGCVSYLSKPCTPSRVMQEVLRFTRSDNTLN